MMNRVTRALRVRRVRRVGAAVLALWLGGCAARATALVLSAGHPADPQTAPSAFSATPVAPVAPVAPDPHAPAAAHATEGYVCPMHPEVTSPSPGACPKCGMALVPVKRTDTPARAREDSR